MKSRNRNQSTWKEEEDEVLPCVKDTAYIIGWKARGGFRPEKEDEKLKNGLPRAIQIPYVGFKGWHPTHSGKLYMLDKLS